MRGGRGGEEQQAVGAGDGDAVVVRRRPLISPLGLRGGHDGVDVVR